MMRTVRNPLFVRKQWQFYKFREQNNFLPILHCGELVILMVRYALFFLWPLYECVRLIAVSKGMSLVVENCCRIFFFLQTNEYKNHNVRACVRAQSSGLESIFQCFSMRLRSIHMCVRTTFAPCDAVTVIKDCTFAPFFFYFFSFFFAWFFPVHSIMFHSSHFIFGSVVYTIWCVYIVTMCKSINAIDRGE